MKRKKKIKDTIANIILAILVVLTLGPIVFMVLTSLMDHNAIARGKWIAPTRFSNYVEVFPKTSFRYLFQKQSYCMFNCYGCGARYCNACRLLFGKIQISGVRFLWYSYSCNAIASWNDVLASSLSRLCLKLRKQPEYS